MKPLGAKLVGYLEHQSKMFSVGFGLLLTLLIAVTDILVTSDVSLTIFYLIPIVVTTWFAGRGIGFLISTLCAIAWSIADLFAKEYSSHLLQVWNGLVVFAFFLITTYLLSELKIAYEREKLLARTDDLTGTVNRRFFLELLQTEIDRSYRHGHHLTIAYMDVDNFKDVNDRFGHKAGDLLLKKIATNITDQVRNTDVVARMGGDEFALFLPETDYESAQIVLQRVHQQLLKVVPNPVSFSIGAVTFLALPKSADVAIDRADQVMYAVKKNGKNRLDHELFTRGNEKS